MSPSPPADGAQHVQSLMEALKRHLIDRLGSERNAISALHRFLSSAKLLLLLFMIYFDRIGFYAARGTETGSAMCAPARGARTKREIEDKRAEQRQHRNPSLCFYLPRLTRFHN
jgi:hypothetical protein